MCVLTLIDKKRQKLYSYAYNKSIMQFTGVGKACRWNPVRSVYFADQFTFIILHIFEGRGLWFNCSAVSTVAHHQRSSGESRRRSPSIVLSPARSPNRLAASAVLLTLHINVRQPSAISATSRSNIHPFATFIKRKGKNEFASISRSLS